MSSLLTAAALVVPLLALSLLLLAAWTAHWGATLEERAASMPGDDYFGEPGAPFVGLTRAVSIQAPPETVWPWLAQCGRGAGWYSVDRLDNGGRSSARHVVSWIPPPRLGDATAVGYLKRIAEPGGLTWWAPGVRFLGAEARLAVDVALRSEGRGSRLVIRMSADAKGLMARPALLAFRLIDGVMARRQLLGLREPIEAGSARAAASREAETGARDQYQLYEVLFASGESAGMPGREHAARWRRAAVAEGVLAANGSARPGVPARSTARKGRA